MPDIGSAGVDCDESASEMRILLNRQREINAELSLMGSRLTERCETIFGQAPPQNAREDKPADFGGFVSETRAILDEVSEKIGYLNACIAEIERL